MSWKDVKKESEDHLSASQIGMYQRCPMQYEFRYVKGIKKAPNSGLILGISVHKGVETNYLHKFKTKKPAKLSEVLDAFSTEWDATRKGADFEGKEPGQVKDTGVQMSRVHYDRLAPAVQPLEKPEYGFEIAIPGVRRKFVGYIDVLAKVLSIPLAVLDNKTTRRRWSQFECDLSTQLTSYVYAVKKIFGKKPVAGLDVVAQTSKEVTGTRFMTMRDDAQLKRFEKTVQGIEAGIKSGIFYPTDNPSHCGWCGYSDSCHYSAIKKRDAMRMSR
jgi:CRISPR/Cas system-associated exonuclease Cas4 (RecB family)